MQSRQHHIFAVATALAWSAGCGGTWVEESSSQTAQQPGVASQGDSQQANEPDREGDATRPDDDGETASGEDTPPSDQASNAGEESAVSDDAQHAPDTDDACAASSPGGSCDGAQAPPGDTAAPRDTADGANLPDPHCDAGLAPPGTLAICLADPLGGDKEGVEACPDAIVPSTNHGTPHDGGVLPYGSPEQEVCSGADEATRRCCYRKHCPGELNACFFCLYRPQDQAYGPTFTRTPDWPAWTFEGSYTVTMGAVTCPDNHGSELWLVPGY